MSLVLLVVLLVLLLAAKGGELPQPRTEAKSAKTLTLPEPSLNQHTRVRAWWAGVDHCCG
jgi:hypothetical protein